jgi:hypothetical protein
LEMRDLGLVTDMVDSAGWKVLRDAALAKVARHEDSVIRLLFRSSTPLDPVKIEYDRGFRQGVMFVLDGLPNAMQAEFKRRLNDPKEVG